jgi:hypothetical protein
MRDKKDNATIDLPGFEPAEPLETGVAESRRNTPRPRRTGMKQEQISLLDETDTTGLPVWRRDDNLDLTGLPVWAPAPSEPA